MSAGVVPCHQLPAWVTRADLASDGTKYQVAVFYNAEHPSGRIMEYVFDVFGGYLSPSELRIHYGPRSTQVGQFDTAPIRVWATAVAMTGGSQ